MCLIVKPGEIPKITSEDILCFKNVNPEKDGWKSYFDYVPTLYTWNIVVNAEAWLFSFHQHEWITHPVDRLEIKVNCDGDNTILYGFHANLKKIAYNRYCIIPAGTEVCYGKYGDVVATHMIVFRRYIDYLHYKLQKIIKTWKEKKQILKNGQNEKSKSSVND